MSLLAELKRRNVLRVGAAYVVVGWLVLQLSDVLISMLALQERVGRGVIFVLVVGFPLALILAWTIGLTPEGVKRDKDVDPEDILQKAKSGEVLDHELYRFLPDYIDPADVLQLTQQTLQNSTNEEPDVTMKKLRILGDRQWHTYRAATNSVCVQLTSWIGDHSSSESQDFIEGALVIAYCYGLTKEMYVQLLGNYRGQHRNEFEKDLERSARGFLASAGHRLRTQSVGLVRLYVL